MINEMDVTITMKRSDVCNLLNACTSIEYLMQQTGNSAGEWRLLHDHLMEALDAFDEAVEADVDQHGWDYDWTDGFGRKKDEWRPGDAPWNAPGMSASDFI